MPHANFITNKVENSLVRKSEGTGMNIDSLLNVKDKIILIVGASSGIGRVFANL